MNIKTQVLVLGSGPGGYSAAFRAADLGLEVVIVEKHNDLGGVCLNVGCIPSKALLHIAKQIDDAASSSHHGLTFQKPQIDLYKINSWKDSVVSKLTKGVAGMAKGRNVKIVQGIGHFTSSNTLTVSQNTKEVDAEGGDDTIIEFDSAIIAAGSSIVELPFIPYDDPRVMNSTSALELKDVPERLLVIGGGIIGLEMGTVYRALGSHVSIVEFADQLVPGADKDLMKIYTKFNQDNFDLMLSTKVVSVSTENDGLHVEFEGKNAPKEALIFDKILVAVGRTPNGHKINADKANINVT